MLKHKVALVTGEDFFEKINKIEEKDMVFLYANDVGIIARGIATRETSEIATEVAFKIARGEPCYEQFRGVRARWVRLSEFAKLLEPIKFSEIPGKAVVMAAVNTINRDLAQRIWDLASGRLS